MHYKRMWKSGTTDPSKKKMPTKPRRLATACRHTDRPHSAHGMCASCVAMEWQRRNPDASSGKKWIKEHPEVGRYYGRKSCLRKKYGLTMGQYEGMWEAQKGKCANPNCDFVGEMLGNQLSGLHIDHCHKTGKIRGLLCHACNKAMGMLGDDPSRLEGLLKYLHEHNYEKLPDDSPQDLFYEP